MYEGGQSFECRGTLTEAQYCRIQWLASRKFILGFGLFLAAILGMTLLSGGARVIVHDPVIQIARVAPFVLLVPIMFFAPRWQARRQYRANAALKGTITGKVTDAGFEFVTEVSQARYRWDQVLKAKIGSDIALVYASPQVAFFLPKSFFATEEAWAGALVILRSKISSVKRA